MEIRKITDAISSYHPSPDISLIKRAYIYSAYYHKNQKRLSGEPYIVHPLSVAKILTELKADDKTVAAGLLHDVVEDTPKTIEEIAKYFGDEVAFLVDGVTKISSFKVNLNADERQIENLRKMFVFMARDIRVILIKLADRLDNIRTAEFLPEEKRRRIAEETLKIFAPIAHRLGLYNIKAELEDRSFEILKPAEARYIKEKLKELAPQHKKIEQEIKEKVSKILKKEGIEGFKIESRVKSIYSIWNKMVNQGIDIENIYDIIGFRIIVVRKEECYRVLGVLHTYFKPIPGKFKDFIAIPKANGYKSLHTKVILERGQRVEFQIRTYEMHKEAEEGIAAHWIYKQGSPISESGLKIFSWLRGVLELSRESPQYEIKKISEDIYPDEIYVFTPKGDVKILPRGATVLDFAFSVHTELGQKCVGARVNGKLQPIDYILRSGDVVEVIVSKSQKPKRTWLNFVATQRAKARIKQFLAKEQRNLAKEIGEEMVKKELKRFGFSFQELMRENIIPKVLSAMNIKSTDDLFVYIGLGKVSINSFLRNVKKTIEEITEKKEKEDISSAQSPEVEAKTGKGKEKKRKDEEVLEEKVLRGDLSGVKMRFALCCMPVYGDEVIGYITRGQGIVIHRKDCSELKKLPKERTIKISPDDLPDEEFVGKIRFVVDALENTSELIKKMKKSGFKIKEMTSKENNSNFEVEMKVKVRNKREIEKLMNELLASEHILKAERP